MLPLAHNPDRADKDCGGSRLGLKKESSRESRCLNRTRLGKNSIGIKEAGKAKGGVFSGFTGRMGDFIIWKIEIVGDGLFLTRVALLLICSLVHHMLYAIWSYRGGLPPWLS